MNSVAAGRRILVAQYRVDMRKGHDGLFAEARSHGLDPFRGDVIVFPSRCRRRIKTLYADSTGLWVSYKRFSADTVKTALVFLDDPAVAQVTPAEFAMLIEGNKYDISRRPEPWKKDRPPS
jgi:hypothetical protein